MNLFQPNAGKVAPPTVRADQAANELPSPLQAFYDGNLVGALVRIEPKDLVHWTLQLAIVALTVPGMWIITGTDDVRYGYLVLLAAQPFWLAAHWRERQWGMFAIALVFAALWLRGILNHFPY